MTELCFLILPAVAEVWGGPQDEGNIGYEYVQAVGNDVRLPAYFRAMEAISTPPLNDVSLHRFWNLYDQDAQMILREGLLHLTADRSLSDDQQARISAMLKLERMAIDDRAPIHDETASLDYDDGIPF